tara:strand:+ start:65 stop:247 length:183 start_codon:yes stop_codon:yes gene_type:complete
MNDEQKLTECYAETLVNVSAAIINNNSQAKKESIIRLLKQLQHGTNNLIKLLEFDDKFLA